MAYFLSELVPTSGLLFDYPLADVTAAGRVDQVTDYSGNARHVEPTAADPDMPSYALSSLNGYPSIVFAGEKPLLYSGGVGQQKHIFAVAKYDAAANFGGTYRGLVTDSASIPVLVGDSGASSTKFYNNTPTSYHKSQVSYAAAAMEAPFSQFELLEITNSSGFSMTDLQLGQNTNNVTHRWLGRLADLKGYSAVLSAAELRRLRLYYDLKYGLFNLNSTTLYFPDPTTTGIYWARFDDEPENWDEVTSSHQYEDDGRSFNTSTDTPTRRWEIGYTGLTKAQSDIFDAFNNAARRDRTFSLIDKYGETQTGVRIESYRRGHEAHKSWSKEVLFRLAKYP